MHMADALVSPAVGGTMLAATAAVAAYAASQIKIQTEDQRIPLMGVTGSFVFAAQMINFTIPATGSSGHLAGGLLLAVLLGPHAGFLTMAAVLLIQAFFFGDGGLLAYGCNVMNLGFFPSFVAYPLIYHRWTRRKLDAKTLFQAALLASVVSLQLGSAGVVMETLLSSRTELPFTTFFLVMQPIHLAIGLVEGLVTAAVLRFLWEARPELLQPVLQEQPRPKPSYRGIAAGFLVAALLLGGLFSWYASEHPDGLEWSIQRITGETELSEPGGEIHHTAAWIQNFTTILPDYQISKEALGGTQAETSLAGILGGFLTLTLVTVIGLLIRLTKGKAKRLSRESRSESRDA